MFRFSIFIKFLILTIKRIINSKMLSLTMLPKKLHVFWYRRLFLDIRDETSLKRILWIGSILMILNIVMVIGFLVLALILYQIYTATSNLDANQITLIALLIVVGLALIIPLFTIFVPGMRALFYERVRRDKIVHKEMMEKDNKK